MRAVRIRLATSLISATMRYDNPRHGIARDYDASSKPAAPHGGGRLRRLAVVQENRGYADGPSGPVCGWTCIR
ncbi:MAG: hypothetical protein OXE94_06465 [Aestuariivita sp.]|nr:hypothetical protein [Aestuariivita sp.]MCY4201701.1 hypothetical protein [Aestuariivita sp.]MCY4347545.1 hypothetical protein [Aestuariivita sp.]